MQGARILVVEDDPAIWRAVEPALAAEGAEAWRAASGGQALELLDAQRFDAILLDLGLPDMDGSEIIATQRSHSDTPILVLSARGRDSDKIRALDAGADDFVVKPFATGELLARIRAALRRRTLVRSEKDRIVQEGLEIDLTQRRVLVHGVEVRLSRREHALICALARAAGGILTHKQIITAVWGNEANADAQFVRVLIGQLRQKIEADPARPQLVCTEPGVGYRLGQRG